MTGTLEKFASIIADRTKPVADQIVLGMIALVESNDLPESTRLPSIRALASQLQVNRNTVAKAFQELGERGYLESRFGGGSIVTRPAPVALPGNGGGHADARAARSVSVSTVANAFDAGDWARRFARQLDNLEHSPLPHQDRGAINLSQMRPYTGLFPVERFRRCLNAVLRRNASELLNYGSPGGYLPLREQISARLTAQGIGVEPAEILITSGSQQGFDLVARAFIEPGDEVVVESPMYSIALKIFLANGARLLPYEIGKNGLAFHEFDRLMAHAPKLFYAVPNYQNPTTYSYTDAEKLTLLEMVYRAESLLIEDATGVELHDHPARHPAIAALDTTSRVIYLNTFSKTMVPAVRAGYVAGPATVMRRLTELKEMTDLSHSLILQGAIAEFMERGYYDEHVTAVRGFYRERVALVRDLLRAALPREAAFTQPEGGLCIWVDLPDHIDTDQLSRELSEQGVLISPAGLYRSMRGGRNGFRICVSHENEARLKTAFGVIGRQLRRDLRQPAPRRPETEYQAIH